MEILKFLLSFLAEEYENGKYEKLYNVFKESNFDLKSTLKNLKPEDVAPVFKVIIEKLEKLKTPQENISYGVEPIKTFAPEEVSRSINNYYS